MIRKATYYMKKNECHFMCKSRQTHVSEESLLPFLIVVLIATYNNENWFIKDITMEYWHIDIRIQ